MQTQITARHFDASSSLRDHAAERVDRLKRYYDGITDVRVVLSENGSADGAKAAEVVLNVYKQTLSARANGGTYEDAIDRSTDNLRRQLMRYKSKLRATDRNVHR